MITALRLTGPPYAAWTFFMRICSVRSQVLIQYDKGTIIGLQPPIRGKTLCVTDPETTSSSAAEIVREATLEDAEAIHALAEDLADALGDWRPRREAVQARLGELLEEPRARVLVAEGEDGIVGAANLWIKADLAHGDSVLEVPMLVVSENVRRRGVGKLLVEEIQSIAAAENVALIELVATRENNAARAFYRSLGFVETEHIALEYVGDVQNPPDPED